MRIAFNAVLLGGIETGVERYIRCLIRALADVDTRNEYLLFTNKTVPHLEEAGASRFEIRRTHFTHKQRLRRIWWEQYALPKILIREKVDVLHAPAYVMPLRSQTPTVVTVHDVLAVTHPQFCRKLNVLHYGLMLPRTARRADRIIASSEATRSAITSHFGIAQSKIAVVYPGVETPSGTGGDTGNLPPKYILFVGRLEPKKNVAALLEAYAWLRENRALPHALVLIGPDEITDPKVAAMLKVSGGNHPIHRVPYVSDDRLATAYANAAAFAFPSLAEGFGFPPLEAMACGTPVVASNIPVLRETLADAAITVPPDDPRLLALAIHKVLNNEFLRRTLAQRGLQRVRLFNWKETAAKIVQVYDEVASTSGRR